MRHCWRNKRNSCFPSNHEIQAAFSSPNSKLQTRNRRPAPQLQVRQKSEIRAEPTLHPRLFDRLFLLFVQDRESTRLGHRVALRQATTHALPRNTAGSATAVRDLFSGRKNKSEHQGATKSFANPARETRWLPPSP